MNNREKHPQKIERLLFLPLITTEGHKLGHVIDIAVDPGANYRVTQLYYGQYGLLHRLHINGAVEKLTRRSLQVASVPWNRVVHIEEKRIIVRKPEDEVRN